MEEVEDIVPEETFPEEVEEIVPEPPPLKRQGNNKLKEKITCEGCGKNLSLHAYKYSHKCKARAPDEPVPQPEEPKPKKKVVNTEKLADSLRDVKPSMTEKQSTKPIRQKSVIQRTPEYQPEPPYQPTQQEMVQHFMQQRQQQAYMRHQAMLAPYQNMLAQRVRV